MGCNQLQKRLQVWVQFFSFSILRSVVCYIINAVVESVLLLLASTDCNNLEPHAFVCFIVQI